MIGMENSFLEIMGNNPKMRLLAFLIEGREFDYSLSDISQNAGIPWTTLHRIMPAFEKSKIVVKTREIGRAKLFRISQESDEAKALIEIFDGILKKELEKHQLTAAALPSSRKPIHSLSILGAKK
jgi:DNA-binding IclR family transcriptional regulator